MKNECVIEIISEDGAVFVRMYVLVEGI